LTARNQQSVHQRVDTKAPARTERYSVAVVVELRRRAGPGIDDPAAAAIVDLQSEQLLVQQGDELGTLSLHRVLRQAVLARLKADGDLFPSLRQQIIELAGVDGHMLGKRIGQVKWFNRNKGFGFLADRDGDTFVQ